MGFKNLSWRRAPAGALWGATIALAAGAAHAQTPPVPPGKVYIEQIPRNLPPRPPPQQPPPMVVTQQRPAPQAAPPAPPPPRPVVNRPAPPPSRPPVAPAQPTRVAASPAAKAAPAKASTCRIQAGAFGRRENADNLAAALRPLATVEIGEMQLGGKPAYRVTLTGLKSRKDAEAMLARLQTGGQKLGALAITGCRA